MSLFDIIVIAIGLSMDAFAVAVASGFTMKEMNMGAAFRIALFFGLFQAFMPGVGWIAGLSISWFMTGFGPWAACIVLTAIGVKMIYEASVFKEEKKQTDISRTFVLIVLSVATSIDACSVGVSFGLMGIEIIRPVLIIGCITFMLSFTGVGIGVRISDKTGRFFENRLEIAGGIILIAIGLRILLGHFF